MYKAMLFTRYDDIGIAYYFSSNDFVGMKKEEYCFTASGGHNLKGYLYSFDNPIPNRIVVFDHGIGGGHLSYMKEISLLCKHGFLVLAYDHTGCMESGGASTNGMAQSLCDLNDCINSIKTNSRFQGFDIAVVGHSWGGYSALNICAFHSDISRIVALSGFVSVKESINSFFPLLDETIRESIMEMEQRANPKFANISAVDTLKNSKVKALLVYSDNDMKCKIDNYEILKTALQGNDNIKFLLEKGKGHNPNYTLDAVNYLNEYYTKLQTLLSQQMLSTNENRAKFVASFDWNRMTAQDENVWKEIIKCLL